MPASKKKISKAKAEMIVEDLKTGLGTRLPDFVEVDMKIREVLDEHFEIVEIDIDEIECSPMGDGFAL